MSRVARLLQALPSAMTSPPSYLRDSCLHLGLLRTTSASYSTHPSRPPTPPKTPPAPRPTAGEVLSLSRCFAQGDVDTFAWMTGDFNPIHQVSSTDSHDDYTISTSTSASASSTPLVPGLLVASTFPALIGTHFPGTQYGSQTLRFRRPVPVGALVDAQVECTRVLANVAKFRTICRMNGEVVVEGEAAAIWPSTTSTSTETM
jgi:3-hydroxybutyryl-CoA dehydratase